ncbi:Imidazolonepropionase [Tenacibaculum sp. MAR_2009_124]|uniref:amidohydrolase family protein n=1 Tax=Tenacibaculum sp. MAR_2009_124 TaxID=1250059 RepID=UPI00089669D2|nr:amidohydrolase family protein [Tenacibaculum sp. MAR_2009_124]SEC87805.1 Imidazolonepropionase [Tenacibaculum sp. MAR_2009_124]
MKKLFILLLFSSLIQVRAQEYFPINTGVKTSQNKLIAFKNAKIFITAQKVLKKGTLLIKDGKVVNVGKSISIPKEAHIIDLNGKSIYPSFIDVYSDFGIKKIKSSFNFRERPQYDAGRKGYYWNDHIRPDIDAFEQFSFDNKKAQELVKLGFGTVNTHVDDGIMQGNGILVTLNTKSNNAYRILNKKSGNYLSFSKSNKSKQAYPTSRMGAMALLRQAYLDAEWYEKGTSKNTDLALEALNNNKGLPQIFKAGDYLNNLRADKIGDEFGIQYTILGGGNEYERIQDIKNTNATFILPINFRKAYDVSNIELAKKIALSDMRKWNQEPSNPSAFQKRGIPFALTTHKLKSLKDFSSNLRKTIDHGLDKTTALEALTTIPAKILNNTFIGNLNKGSYANFIISSGDIFDKSTTLYENWVQGAKHIVNPIDVKDITGDYTLKISGNEYLMSITGKGEKQTASLKKGKNKVSSKFSFKNGWIQLTVNDKNNFSRISGKTLPTSNNLNGTGIDNIGNSLTWSAIKKESKKKDKKDKSSEEAKIPEVVSISYPNVGFGNYSIPNQETILIKNTTIWTSENSKVLKNTDLLISEGKISKIGKKLSSRKAKVIDGTGKYLTAGIIDEHSHIAASAINEAGHNSSAEVTIEDVVAPDDINIYRNIAGGVTSIQILHGSANPIGGRSAIIKLKWGENADNLIYNNTPKFIKFALGENVKQSNWGDNNTIRFPQTRMGVEQVYIDYFQRAKEYDALKKSGKPYRKDIELETLAEILNKERFISCHSYVQSEINMLMKVAEQFDFNINTFTHILEGYKVADKMKEHGVGGSTFSDWWAYKYEVNDAIPYNAAMMHRQGIIVAINSDDAEMSRRLNQEAAKTMKYGGLTEQEAWSMVTINPAKLLHLDDRTGSIKVGKDADVVLWSNNPLSVYSKAEKTIIDGTIYFDLEKDIEKRKSIQQERAKLINMMLKEKIKGAPTQSPVKKVKKLFHCDTE